MELLQELGVDALGPVRIAQEGWHQTALSMIDARRKQVTAAQGRAKTEEQQEAVLKELKRMSDLEFYVRGCAALVNAPPHGGAR
jgi:hypothetical protein